MSTGILIGLILVKLNFFKLIENRRQKQKNHKKVGKIFVDKRDTLLAIQDLEYLLTCKPDRHLRKKIKQEIRMRSKISTLI